MINAIEDEVLGPGRSLEAQTSGEDHARARGSRGNKTLVAGQTEGLCEREFTIAAYRRALIGDGLLGSMGAPSCQ